MPITYRKADIDDLEILVKTRLDILKVINNLGENEDMTEFESQTADYYRSSLLNGSHAAYLVFDGDKFIGAGGITGLCRHFIIPQEKLRL